MKKVISLLKSNLDRSACTLFVVLCLLGLAPAQSRAAASAFDFSAANYWVKEGTANAYIVIKRTGDFSTAATVKWQTNGITAVSNGQDYVGFGPTTVSFVAGETQKKLGFKIVDDFVVEPNETLKLTLSSPTGGATLGAVATAVVAIRDNDDPTAPNVSLTSPANGATFSSAQTVTITASATDNVGVTKVELYDGTALKATDTTVPYAFTWPITAAGNGSHSLTVKAYDAAGNSKVSNVAAVSVNIPLTDLTAPTVALASPAAGAVFTSVQSVTIAATAADNVAVSKVEFYDGTTLLGSDSNAPYSFVWPIATANNGSHSLTAKAYDTAGNSTTSASGPVTVNIAAVDLVPPTVSLASPVAGATFTSAQTITIAATATDNVAVSKVEFYDGTTLLGTDSTIPYSVTWAISSGNNGNHSLTAKAYDAAGNNQASAPISLIVNIGVATPTLRPDGKLPTFPGAEGFAAGTAGGRGGTIIKVTNLNDSGAGSLRSALMASGPRIVVFEVAGSIQLQSEIYVNNPYLTIAGQTAPEPGIQLRNYGLQIDTHDVLVQHLRIRIEGGTRDCIWIHANANEVYNVLIDHCTLNWGSDENLDVWAAQAGKGLHDVTVSNCLIAESGYGMLMGTNSTNANWLNRISIIDNLFANNNERNPLIGNNVNAFIANNLAFNTGLEFTAVVGNYGPKNATFAGNHYIGGPSGRGSTVIGMNSAATPGSYYVNDCLVTGRNVGSLLDSYISRYLVGTMPVTDPTVTVTSANQVRDRVLRTAGARPASRDSVEVRIVNEVMAETGSVKRSALDAGGWPADYNAPSYRTFDVGPNPAGDDDKDGYTNVEEILHQMAAQLEGR